MHFNTLTEWLSWLESLPPKTSRLPQAQFKSIAERLNIWPIPCPVITVTGTNGKGSCVALLASCLIAAGKRVATYTSPHLLKYNERICCNNIPISDNTLCDAFAAVEQARKEVPLNYFEFTTLAAFYIFKQISLDAWILEVGIGGRLDPVNIIDADVAIISTVAIDHAEWLGATRELIGREKSGIMRPHKPVICGDFETPNSIIEYAEQLGSPLYRQGTDFGFIEEKGRWTWWSKSFGEIHHLPLPHVELQNAATVLAALACMPISLFQNNYLSNHEVKQESYDVCESQQIKSNHNVKQESDYVSQSHRINIHKDQALEYEQIKQGSAVTVITSKKFTPLHHCLSHAVKSAFNQALQQTHLLGRFQKISGAVTQILDVAHNPAAAELLSSRLNGVSCTGRRLAVVAILADKDLLGTVTPLLPLIDVWHVGEIQNTRGSSAEELGRILSLHGASFVYTYASVSSAYLAAVADACSGDLIVVFGSFYTVSEVLQTL